MPEVSLGLTKLLTVCIFSAKGHLREVKWSSGEDQIVDDRDLDTRRGGFDCWTPHNEQAITGAGSWSDWMKAWLVDCKDEEWWGKVKMEKEGSINTNLNHSRGPFFPVCVLLLHFRTMWPIWVIGSNKAHPKDISGLYFRGIMTIETFLVRVMKSYDNRWEQLSLKRATNG